MNYRRWLIVGYVLLLMVFTTSVLLIPGQKYDTLTTSDSGWVYDIAAEINRTNALAENNPLSHAPYGLRVSPMEQAQPLLTVMLYRGVSAVNPSVTLMDVVKYWAPLIFALSLIPIFLTAKELGGDLAGCAAAFFAATLVSSIYWHKVGAYDREPVQLILGAWSIYLTIKLFKAPQRSIPKFALLAGLVYGLFALAWMGWHYIFAIMILGLVFVLLAGFLGKLLHKISDVFGALFSAIRGHLDLLVGMAGMMVVITLVLWVLGGQGPEMWAGIFQTYAGYIGIGGGGEGVLAPRYAGEMAPPSTWGDTIGRFYAIDILTAFILILIILALFKFIWSRKRWELVTFAWLIILAAMVWPGVGQVRFERLWWIFVPVLAGVGAATLARLARRFSFEPSGDWLKHLQNPIAILLIVSIIAAPFVVNAYNTAYKTTPPTEWHGFRGIDEGFMEAFDWLRENTLKDSVVSIQWSFGHLLTGTAERATVCDGAEVAAEEGKWENDPSFVPRPPDYIYYDTQRDSMRIRNYYGMYNAFGEYISAKSYAVNGRRIDVQRFPIVGENEFRWYLTAYRDNYGVKIDYVIFSYDEYYNAWSYYNSTQPMNILLGAQRLRAPSQLQPSVEGQNYVFNFGENREAVVLDVQNRNVYLRVGAESLGLDGYGVFTVNKQGKISDYLGFSPPPSTPAIEETMLVFLDERGSIISAWLVKGVSAEVTGRPVPMAVRVFTGDIGGIEYLQVSLTSSNGLVKVIKINHVPALIFPANGARTNDSTPELIWSGAIGAAKYKLEVDDNTDFSSPVVQGDNLTTKSYTTPVLADDNYSWRVGAYNNKGDFLGWSDVFTFVIDTQPPSQPLLSSPQDGAELTSLVATFEWAIGLGADNHRLLVDEESDFSSPVLDVTLGAADNTYTPPTELAPDTYWWKVVAVDAAGNENSSPVRLFTVTPPGV